MQVVAVVLPFAGACFLQDKRDVNKKKGCFFCSVYLLVPEEERKSIEKSVFWLTYVSKYMEESTEGH